MKIRVLELSDYNDIISLWRSVEGICIRDEDSKEGIERYLKRNPNLSFAAFDQDKLIGTIMSGHDSRRGYIQHLAVAENYQNQGIATALVKHCLAALKNEGIVKSHIQVLSSNTLAKRYWENKGWFYRDEIDMYSFINA